MYDLIEGKKIWFTDSGKGRVVVLLHGYLESTEIWDGFAEDLVKTSRVICIDLPGHGKSDVYGNIHTMEFMAGIVRRLLDSLGITKLFLAGHSLGGYVTMAFADLYPWYLDGYSLFHSHPFADTPETREKRMNEIKMVEEGKKELVYPGNVEKEFATSNLEVFADELKRARNIASLTPGEGIIAVLNGMIARPSRESIIVEGRKPFLWILGRLDNYIPFEVMSKRVKLPLNARLAVLEKSGHLGFIEERDRSVEIFTEFLKSI